MFAPLSTQKKHAMEPATTHGIKEYIDELVTCLVNDRSRKEFVICDKYVFEDHKKNGTLKPCDAYVRSVPWDVDANHPDHETVSTLLRAVARFGGASCSDEDVNNPEHPMSQFIFTGNKERDTNGNIEFMGGIAAELPPITQDSPQSAPQQQPDVSM